MHSFYSLVFQILNAVDCKLGHWAAWSIYSGCKCPSHSKPGTKHRMRTVLAKPEYGGKQCEDENGEKIEISKGPFINYVRVFWGFY